jgi:hypothetical protein
LRELIAKIEQLPASAESERMLREVRARLVDVDTGVTPREMLPADPMLASAIEPGPPAPRAPKAAAGKTANHERARPDVSPAAASLTAAEDREWLSLVATNKVLSLDDAVQISPPGEARTEQDRRPWTRGLRG